MSGRIPPYGKNFRLEQTRYHPALASRVYALKRDPAWFIRSDKTSGEWQVYWRVPGTGATFDTAAPVGTPLPTLGQAMTRLLDGIAEGFYTITEQESTS
jgi:hypothetical protein